MTYSRAHSMAFLAPEVPPCFSIHQHHLAPSLGGLPFSGVPLLSKEVSKGHFLREMGREPGLALTAPTGREADGPGDKGHAFQVPIDQSLPCQGPLMPGIPGECIPASGEKIGWK